MDSISAILADRFLVLLLVFVRMSSLFVITPVFGRRELPAYFKIGLAFFCSYILVPLLGDVHVEYSSLLSFSVIIAREFLVGIIIGFASFLVFSALYVAGQIIDMQVGFGMINVLDPTMNTQVPLIGNFMYIITTILFLAIDGHHILLAALYKSYSILPINGFAFTEAMVNNITVIFAEVFVIGFKISIPVIAAALLAEVALGVLSRTVPQMNVFIVGIPLKIGIGLLTLYIMMPVFIQIMTVIFDRMYGYIYLIIRSMAKG
ncbi:MAG: flagellar biosynthetic protein FliR [Clostridiaceae bacterium]|jgi:flagellar biosynthetic protein FliR|nr:flagellar biosynthetic protein FliR [Clostridiaceae bacterium]